MTWKLLAAGFVVAFVVSLVLAFAPTSVSGIDCGGVLTGRFSPPAICADQRSSLGLVLAISSSLAAVAGVASFFSYLRHEEATR